MRKQARIGLALFLWGGVSSVAWSADPPIAASFSNVSPSQIQANWTDTANPPGTTYYAILSTGTSPSTNNFIDNISSATGTHLDFLFTPLQPNTTYFVDVNATNPTGSTSTFTSLGSTITWAMPPTGSVVSAVTTSGFTYTWNVNTNPTGTRFEVSTSTDDFVTNFSTPIQITSNFTSNTTIFNTLASGTTYYVRVRAANAGGVLTGFDSVLSTQTLLPPPGIPQNLSGSALGVSSISWTWNAVTSASSYNVYEATSPTTRVGNTPTTTFTDTGLLTNTAYGRVVTAVVSGVESGLSTSATTYTLAVVPGTPAFSNVFTSSFTVTWTTNGNPNSTPYEVSQSTDNFVTNFSTPVAFSANLTNPTTTLLNLTPGTLYSIRIRAQNGSNLVTSFSAVGSTQTQVQPAGIPQNLSGTAVSASSISWTWDAVSGATSYKVYEATSTNVLLATVGTNSWLETGLAVNSVHARVVTSIVGSLESGLSNNATAVTFANIPVIGAAPVILSTQITANWGSNNNPSGITTYQAQISQDAGFISSTTFTTANLSVPFPNLSSDTTYYMRVSAINQAGFATSPANLQTARTLPGVPGAQPFTNISQSQIQANWTAPANGADNSYKVVISSALNPSSNNLPLNQSTITFNTSYAFPNLLPNVLYFVDIEALNNSGNSGFAHIGSTPTWANVPGVGTPPVVLSSTQITANWTANGNPSGTSYLAQISQDPGFSSSTTVTTSNLSVTFPNLNPNTTYFMQVSAVNQAGIVTTPTTLAPARTLPGAPTPAPFTNVSPTALQANWNSALRIRQPLLSGYPVLRPQPQHQQFHR